LDGHKALCYPSKSSGLTTRVGFPRSVGLTAEHAEIAEILESLSALPALADLPPERGYAAAWGKCAFSAVRNRPICSPTLRRETIGFRDA